ncbi:retron St85 family RNA-directed DNA polymerase [Hoeflea sp.]|uniref:retron St85 family RNA-directed DNA polymerase n=1 Tax=Hoeflea sp. TaxID=1940281 RepID=UPI0025BA2948|nr:retron St85 family RNA-directed DNA polymerase [Hoeflea sp.]
MSNIVEALAIETGMDVDLVERIMRSAPVRYKTYRIPKRTKGFREISQPAVEVKALQRGLVENLLRNLPMHQAATAYRMDMSIKDNALRHAGDGPILKMDFKNFFPSIKPRDWSVYCEQTGVLIDPVDVRLTSLLLFQRPTGSSVSRLAIGAPSSPFLSNALMFEFDQVIADAVAKDHVAYTRYADDLTFSAPRTGHLVNVEKIVRTTLRALAYPKLTVNDDKTTRVTRKYGRKVTGLTLTNDGKVSIGHKRKRNIHAAVHHASLGKLSKESLGELKGLLGFANSAEPQFIGTLKEKYGAELIHFIQTFDTPKRQR